MPESAPGRTPPDAARDAQRNAMPRQLMVQPGLLSQGNAPMASPDRSAPGTAGPREEVAEYMIPGMHVEETPKTVPLQGKDAKGEEVDQAVLDAGLPSPSALGQPMPTKRHKVVKAGDRREVIAWDATRYPGPILRGFATASDALSRRVPFGVNRDHHVKQQRERAKERRNEARAAINAQLGNPDPAGALEDLDNLTHPGNRVRPVSKSTADKLAAAAKGALATAATIDPSDLVDLAEEGRGPNHTLEGFASQVTLALGVARAIENQRGAVRRHLAQQVGEALRTRGASIPEPVPSADAEARRQFVNQGFDAETTAAFDRRAAENKGRAPDPATEIAWGLDGVLRQTMGYDSWPRPLQRAFNNAVRTHDGGPVSAINTVLAKEQLSQEERRRLELGRDAVASVVNEVGDILDAVTQGTTGGDTQEAIAKLLEEAVHDPLPWTGRANNFNERAGYYYRQASNEAQRVVPGTSWVGSGIRSLWGQDQLPDTQSPNYREYYPVYLNSYDGIGETLTILDRELKFAELGAAREAYAANERRPAAEIAAYLHKVATNVAQTHGVDLQALLTTLTTPTRGTKAFAALTGVGPDVQFERLSHQTVDQILQQAVDPRSPHRAMALQALDRLRPGPEASVPVRYARDPKRLNELADHTRAVAVDASKGGDTGKLKGLPPEMNITAADYMPPETQRFITDAVHSGGLVEVLALTDLSIGHQTAPVLQRLSDASPDSVARIDLALKRLLFPLHAKNDIPQRPGMTHPRHLPAVAALGHRTPEEQLLDALAHPDPTTTDRVKAYQAQSNRELKGKIRTQPDQYAVALAQAAAAASANSSALASEADGLAPHDHEYALWHNAWDLARAAAIQPRVEVPRDRTNPKPDDMVDNGVHDLGREIGLAMAAQMPIGAIPEVAGKIADDAVRLLGSLDMNTFTGQSLLDAEHIDWLVALSERVRTQTEAHPSTVRRSLTTDPVRHAQETEVMRALDMAKMRILHAAEPRLRTFVDRVTDPHKPELRGAAAHVYTVTTEQLIRLATSADRQAPLPFITAEMPLTATRVPSGIVKLAKTPYIPAEPGERGATSEHQIPILERITMGTDLFNPSKSGRLPTSVDPAIDGVGVPGFQHKADVSAQSLVLATVHEVINPFARRLPAIMQTIQRGLEGLSDGQMVSEDTRVRVEVQRTIDDFIAGLYATVEAGMREVGLLSELREESVGSTKDVVLLLVNGHPVVRALMEAPGRTGSLYSDLTEPGANLQDPTFINDTRRRARQTLHGI